jgi:hypothetical protein
LSVHRVKSPILAPVLQWLWSGVIEGRQFECA